MKAAVVVIGVFACAGLAVLAGRVWWYQNESSGIAVLLSSILLLLGVVAFAVQ